MLRCVPTSASRTRPAELPRHRVASRIELNILLHGAVGNKSCALSAVRTVLVKDTLLAVLQRQHLKGARGVLARIDRVKQACSANYCGHSHGWCHSHDDSGLGPVGVDSWRPTAPKPHLVQSNRRERLCLPVDGQHAGFQPRGAGRRASPQAGDYGLLRELRGVRGTIASHMEPVELPGPDDDWCGEL